MHVAEKSPAEDICNQTEQTVGFRQIKAREVIQERSSSVWNRFKSAKI